MKFHVVGWFIKQYNKILRCARSCYQKIINYIKQPHTFILWLIEGILLCIAVLIGFCTGAWLPIIILIIIILCLIYKDALAKIFYSIEKVKLFSWLEISLRNISEIEISLHNLRDLIAENKISAAIELIDSTKNKIKGMKTNMELQAESKKSSSQNSKTDAICEVGDNANGIYYRYNNGIQIISKSVKGPVDKNETFIFPATFAKAPFFIQFIGIEQPILFNASESYVTVLFKNAISEDTVFNINALGVWKS